MEKQKTPLTKKEKNWILYDVANSAYVLLATALLNFYFDYLSPTENLTSIWGLVNVIVTVIAIFLCPILGTFADFSGKRKFFILFAAVGMVGCGLLSLFSFISKLTIAGLLFLIVYIVTEVGHSSALVFYDSMLGDITTDEKMHDVSAQGYAWGYIGSCIPFVLCLVLYVLGGMVFVEPDGSTPFLGTAFSLCCIITAVWWLILPCPSIRATSRCITSPSPKSPYALPSSGLAISSRLWQRTRRRSYSYSPFSSISTGYIPSLRWQ